MVTCCIFNCKNHKENSRFGFVDGLILHDACESPVELDMDDKFVLMTGTGITA